MKRKVLLIAVLSSLSMAACSGTDEARRESDEDATPAMHTEANGGSMNRTAGVEIQPMKGSGVIGTITFTEVDEGVELSGTVRGLQPGLHGFHIHEGVTCQNYGDHYNPTDHPHGAPEDYDRHVGDLGNMEAGADSTATIDRTDSVIALFGADTIVGHALIIHQGNDDFTTQPSGDSGPEVGCGIIELQ